MGFSHQNLAQLCFSKFHIPQIFCLHIGLASRFLLNLCIWNIFCLSIVIEYIDTFNISFSTKFIALLYAYKFVHFSISQPNRDFNSGPSSLLCWPSLDS